MTNGGTFFKKKKKHSYDLTHWFDKTKHLAKFNIHTLLFKGEPIQ